MRDILWHQGVEYKDTLDPKVDIHHQLKTPPNAPAMRIYVAFLLLHLPCYLFSPAKGHPHLVRHSMHDNTTDQLALLSFKSHITHDPLGVLNTWNTSTPLCNWQGIRCNIARQRVTHINLNDLNLEGILSPHITNLTFLRVLNLTNNSFHGPLPVDMGRIFRLHHLTIDYNHFQGRLPSSLSLCRELLQLNILLNKFEGLIPSELGSLRELRILDLAGNHFTGQIPPSLGNLSSLEFLVISGRDQVRDLQGAIPMELARLQKLVTFVIADTNLEGEIPRSLLNISSLAWVGFMNNRFSGSLHSDMFSTLPNLVKFYVGLNYLSGPIPVSIANASNLKLLHLEDNSFSGRIPLLSNLRNMQEINLEFNKLGGDSDADMEFISSLANSDHLELLSVAGNKLKGELPSSIGNLSKELSMLFMGGNQLEGSLPAEISNLVGLTILAVDYNSFSGHIPTSLGEMPLLQSLRLSSNRFSGSIPDSLGNLPHLFQLYMNNNSFTGTIPASLSGAQQLQFIDLSHNLLIGSIPREIFSLPNLINVLTLSSNSLSGSIPMEVGKLAMLRGLDFSNNQMSGEIPLSIGSCISLLNLGLSGNSFQGPIPNSLANLKSVEYIDLSSNNLSGEIPSTLQSLKFIILLNLSMNQLEGAVPKDGIFRNSTAVSLDGNSYLCGGVSAFALPKCKIPVKHSDRSKMKLVIEVVVPCVGLGFLSCLFFFVFRRRNTNGPKTIEDVISFEGELHLYTYHDLRRATNNFSADNLIGEGSFGRVYKGILSNETIAAIKVFNMNRDKFLKSFYHECEALRSVRHRNLVKIISACSSSEFKALVLKFMPNGSLEQWISRPVAEFSTTQKLKVALDVAAAMEYLHHDSETPVVHCDLKPSNILLDEDMVAHVADFGLARMLLVNPKEGPLSSTLGLKGSVGYIAPEYGMCAEASLKGDVYSYGILLLELFTGKKPTDEMFVGDLDLQKWVAAALADSVINIVDAQSLQDDERAILVAVLKTGLACASLSPEDRPTMRDVSNMIRSAKK